MDSYNYAIEVNPVDRCPMNESDWEAAANRTGCNDTRGYHCVPDKFHESLIEFCYIKPRILVANGKYKNGSYRLREYITTVSEKRKTTFIK